MKDRNSFEFPVLLSIDYEDRAWLEFQKSF